MMTYGDFLEWDTYNLYSDYLSIKKAKELELIPRKLVNVIPDNCKCGSENIIQTNLKRMRCCDPNCYIKIGKAMSHMFTNFEVIGLGDETCIKLVEHCMRRGLFTIPSHVEILGVEIDQEMKAVFGAKAGDLAIGVNYIKLQTLTFGGMIKKMSIPMFDGSSDVIFQGVNGIAHFLELIEGPNGLTRFMFSKGVKDLVKIDTLRRNLPAILYMENALHKTFIQSSNVTKTVCITGSVKADNVRYSRDAFVNLCNRIGNVNGVQLFNVKENHAMETNRYIIADSACNHSKYLAGKRREQVEGRKIIITAQEYVDLLREEVKECIEKLKETSSK